MLLGDPPEAHEVIAEAISVGLGDIAQAIRQSFTVAGVVDWHGADPTNVLQALARVTDPVITVDPAITVPVTVEVVQTEADD